MRSGTFKTISSIVFIIGLLIPTFTYSQEESYSGSMRYNGIGTEPYKLPFVTIGDVMYPVEFSKTNINNLVPDQILNTSGRFELRNYEINENGEVDRVQLKFFVESQEKVLPIVTSNPYEETRDVGFMIRVIALALGGVSTVGALWLIKKIKDDRKQLF